MERIRSCHSESSGCRMSAQSCIQLFSALEYPVCRIAVITNKCLPGMLLLVHVTVEKTGRFLSCCVKTLALWTRFDFYRWRAQPMNFAPKKTHLARSRGQILSLLQPALVTHLEHPAEAPCKHGLQDARLRMQKECKTHISWLIRTDRNCPLAGKIALCLEK